MLRMRSSPSYDRMHQPSSISPCKARIVIVGAGLAGIRAAKRLSGAGAEIILVDRQNYHTFVPLLYQVATGFISANTIAYPIRSWVRRIPHGRFLLATVARIDLVHQQVIADSVTLSYDYLILATGSRAQFLGVSGAAEYAFTLRTLEDAIALRHQILTSLEKAAQTNEQRYLTFVIVGGGPTGVEIAGALKELIHQTLRAHYPTLDPSQARIVLVQSAETLLPSFPGAMGAYTLRQLRQRRIEVCLNVKVSAVQTDGVTLSNGQQIAAQTVIWTAGVSAEKPKLLEPVKWTSAAKEITACGKVVVEPTLQIANYPNVYVVGDAAYVEHNGKALFGVAPEALQQGATAADNILRQLRGQDPQPFQYFDKGRAAIVARHAGVAYLLSKIKITGLLGWLTWLVIHLYYLPGLGNRLTLLLSWLRDYVLRDRAHRQILPTPAPPNLLTQKQKRNPQENSP